MPTSRDRHSHDDVISILNPSSPASRILLPNNNAISIFYKQLLLLPIKKAIVTS